MNIVFFLIGLISGLIMTGLVYVILHKRNEELKKEVDEVISLKATNQALQNRMEDIRLEINDNKQTVEEKNKEIQNNIRLIAQYKTQNEAFIEKLDNQKNEILNLREELNKEFKLLANEILDEKTKKFSELNEEKISTILNPLKEKIQTFEKKVEETYNNETREKASLRKELEQIININPQIFCIRRIECILGID